jgi:hypothetical protein
VHVNGIDDDEDLMWHAAPVVDGALILHRCHAYKQRIPVERSNHRPTRRCFLCTHRHLFLSLLSKL